MSPRRLRSVRRARRLQKRTRPRAPCLRPPPPSSAASPPRARAPAARGRDARAFAQPSHAGKLTRPLTDAAPYAAVTVTSETCSPCPRRTAEAAAVSAVRGPREGETGEWNLTPPSSRAQYKLSAFV